MCNDFNFTDKVYIVTGASSGLGRKVAKCLSDYGAIIVLTGRNQTQLETTEIDLAGCGHLIYMKDLLDDDYTDLFDFIHSNGKRIDGIVHCAGIAPIIPLPSLNRKWVEQCMKVNFYSLVELMRLYSKKKYRSEKGCVVAVSSISSYYPDKCQTVYAASKAALNTAVQGMALELAKKNVRINAVVPGSMDTEMSLKAFHDMGEVNKERKLSKQILGLTDANDVAKVVMFLLSDMSNAITGRTIFADGGYINF
ncbi:MAG: SDR family oxidoreductase [Lachnospiraceae bacterium]|nr:SDR family oxidoreductase [Lachnospiraceae bacterium]